MADSGVDLKVVFLGNSGVGKSCLLVRYLTQKFGATESTIGASFAQKVIGFEGDMYKIGFWDTAGAERFESLSPLYCRGATCAVLVADLTDAASLPGLRKWNRFLKENNPTDGYFTIVVGSKKDLVDDGTHERAFGESEVEKLREELAFAFYFETSALTGENVDDVFMSIVKEYKHRQEMKLIGTSGKKGVKMEQSTQKKKSGCC
eukprot:TRINITY_DN82845_c0_g1_i1.p1 TRINITY_DN82845_c0_g1~~TRINITY_DN82845_c0_g1_i1.p1  ORF type:complete len:205 (-),score=60.11 TRINITY_DN82845_c0_g1_i1:206-820(-)